MTHEGSGGVKDSAPEVLAARLFRGDCRALVIGEPGVGKSTLVAGLAAALTRAGRTCFCIGADPGSPAFGVPGAVCLGWWERGEWALNDLEALCTLDAGRFRLPLIFAASRLAERAGEGVLLFDGPGVVRGVAGAELVEGIVTTAQIDLVLVIAREGKPSTLERDLRGLGATVHVVEAAPQAHPPGKRTRARARTRLWDAWLETGSVQEIDLDAVSVHGTPPPPDVPEAWAGRQIGLLQGRRTVALGEVVSLDDTRVRARLSADAAGADGLLVRDAARGEDSLLGTVKPFGARTVSFVPPSDVIPQVRPGDSGGSRPVVRVGPATVTLVNGIFGDPLLHIRLRHHKRSLLFDLGEAVRLPARIAHQVTDVFVSHAHFDHIAGFLWLLRSRIADLPACRLYGPPGLAGNIQGLVNGIHWDRIGDRGPEFDVAELHGEEVSRYRIKAGQSEPVQLPPDQARDGLLLAEDGFRVRATTLDHGTPVLAFAFEPAQQINVRKERLLEQGFEPGPWLTDLKAHVAAGDRDAVIRLPDGTRRSTGDLADELVLLAPGQKLAYATDLADTSANRERLAALARGAHTFFCEAPFLEADAEQAVRTGHLTTRACAEIANAAGVERLVPFHFSRRYEGEPGRIYAEVRAVCSRTVVPRASEL